MMYAANTHRAKNDASSELLSMPIMNTIRGVMPHPSPTTHLAETWTNWKNVASAPSKAPQYVIV
jgi:hypothetical protein